MKWGPTSANCLRHGSCLSALQKEKNVCARPFQRQSAKNPDRARHRYRRLDSEFYERLPQLFPHGDARSCLPPVHNLPKKQRFATVPCRRLSDRRLPCAGAGYRPDVGLDRQYVDDAFFAGSTLKSNLLLISAMAIPANFLRACHVCP